MPPMANDARAGFIPIVTAPARQIVPVERFVVKIARGPLWHPGEHILLRDQSPARVLAKFRLRKFVCEIQAGANPDDEDTSPALCDTVMLRIQDLPFDLVPGQPVSAKLIVQQLPVLAIGHAIYVFDDERLWANDAQNPVELLIQEID